MVLLLCCALGVARGGLGTLGLSAWPTLLERAKSVLKGSDV